MSDEWLEKWKQVMNISDELIINNQLSFIDYHLYYNVSQFDEFVAV